MTYNEISASLTDIFKKDFRLGYGTLRNRKKTKLIRHTSSFFRRWYYSAMVENTIITPANLISALNEQRGLGQDTYISLRLKSFERLAAPVFETIAYSKEKHPVINDIKIFLESCEPDFELTERDSLTDRHLDYLMERVSISDPFYLDYLTLICVNMGLICKAPSVHSNRARVRAGCWDYLNMNGELLLGRIVDISCEIAAFFINSLLPEENYMHKDFILHMLRHPMTTDEVYKYVYSGLGMDIQEALECCDEEETGEFYTAIISNTFYLGVLLDKYFHTIFGYYLKLINPGYLIPYDFDKDLSYAAEALREDDLSVAMFSPCSHYSHTRLGLDFFGIGPEDAAQHASKKSLDYLLRYLVSEDGTLENFREEIDMHMSLSGIQSRYNAVYELKIRLGDNKSMWKSMEVIDCVNLHELCMDIGFEFFAMPAPDYSLYAGAEENPFLEYSPRRKDSRVKCSDKFKLKELGLKAGGRLLLVYRNVFSPYDMPAPMGSDGFYDGAVTPVLKKSVRLEIEIRKEKEFNKNALYPFVIRESTAIKRAEELLRRL